MSTRYAAAAIVPSARACVGYAQKLLAGIDPALAARKPLAHDRTRVDTNHPTFVYGHLSLYPARMLTLLGREPGPTPCPPAWTALFDAGVACRDDAEGTIYPALDAVSAHFFRTSEHVLGVLDGLSDEVLSTPHPDEARRARFPTLGSAMSFYLLAHTMMHMGQVSAWRRCFGLPSAM